MVRMSGPGDKVYNFPPLEYGQSGGSPSTSFPNNQLSGAGTAGGPATCHCDFVNHLQRKIAALEHQLMCSHAETENLNVQLDDRTKALASMTEKYAKLEEDQNFAQKCVKLEAKIAVNRAISADHEKIKELEEAVKKLEGDKDNLEVENKSLKETLEKKDTELGVQRSLIQRCHGLFGGFAQAATESFKEVENFVEERHGEENTSFGQSPTSSMQGIGDNMNMNDSVSSFSRMSTPPRSWRSTDEETELYFNSSDCSTNDERLQNNCVDPFERNRYHQDRSPSPPPPAAFLDAINGLTREDLEELEKMEMERRQERGEN